MSFRFGTKHYAQPTRPTQSIQIGDEWFNTSNNRLYKYLIKNGTSIEWVEVPSAAATTIYNGPPEELFLILTSGWTGRDGTGVQGIFGLGATALGTGVQVRADTIYQLEMNVTLIKTAGTTSHTISTAFGGTANINFIYYNVLQSDENGGMNSRFTIFGSTAVNTRAATVITGALGAATQYFSMYVKGVVSFRTAGTFIPQYVLSAVPGGAYTTQTGSSITLTAIPSSIGTWA